ncbi:Hint domain-containing protein [Paracoccus aminophilus]|uniref:Hedgehog/Intein (Hint) domain-containing protein n=1 Tax=Paracoccus aminophilus JCM 7686 TaxID=1367847 RepID=S5YVN8_PARAH|nr:Hint domain-containing protein [Paracoccus aminophilus]AGT09301.1 hypothetical protein JCM7686_2222 [Paracoccus aminophilus JCM 7686]
MPERTLDAWNLELTELGYLIPGWTFDDSSYGSSGPPYDLTPYLMQVEVSDVNGDGTISVNTGDTIAINGVPQKIGLIYYGDTAVINGLTIQTVSFYVGPGNAIPIVFPIVNGKVSSAFAGNITSSEGTGSFGTPISYDQFTCFAKGTLIASGQGVVAIEMIDVGDEILTKDNGLQTVRWIGSRKIDLIAAPHLAPIRIAAGALGPRIPSTDLVVSPQHRVLVRSKIAQRMFGTTEMLVAVKQLLQIDGVEIAEEMTEVHYFHILCDRHEIVLSNGAETETLYTGAEAIKAVGAAAREEILAIFPELQDRAFTPEPARVLASGRMGRKLAVRHAQHERALVS